MNTQQKLYKIFQLIRLLNTPPAMDVPQLVRRLDSSKSRIYEHLQLLEKLGYKIKTDNKHRKSLELGVSKFTSGLLDSQDLELIQESLQQTRIKNPLRTKLLHKLNANLSLIPLADALPQLHASRIIQLIRVGIESQRQMMLRNYRSMTSNNMEDRHIEPLELTKDFRYLIAWDLKKNGQRQFKLERIEDVDLLDEKIQGKRISSPMDLFGLTSDDEMEHQWHDVKLKLTSTAHHLLIEEFPLSRQYIKRVKGVTIFEGRVRHWKGVGRFCLGLPGEVEVLGPEEFRRYLNGKVEAF